MNSKALERALDFIRPWLRLRYERIDVPGFQVAVSVDGTLVLNEAFGHADLERDVALRTDHIFRIASHSKTFTATAIMILQEEGRLRLDDPLEQYVPWLRDHRDRRYGEVSVRHLLSHGASVIRDGVDSDFWQLLRPFPDQAGFMEEILGIDLTAAVNTKMKYSNFGYTLLGRVVEQASGQPYNDFVMERIVRPLGLSNTYAEYAPGHAERVVTGYARKGGGRRLPIVPIDTRAMSPATGFCSTAADLTRYFTAHMVGSGELLSDVSKKEMQKIHWHAEHPGQEQQRDDYGLGLELETVGKRRTFGHSGGFPGHITKSKADPKDRIVVVALTNSLDGPASQIVNGIYKIIDYFQENTPDSTVHDFSHLEGFYEQLWSTTAVAATKSGLAAVDPDQWEPFQSVETLEYVEPDTFRIVDADSYGSAGELVKFKVRDGKVETIRFTGATVWPRDVWQERQRGLDRIG
jgi:D-alanyl-D-alanine carboxypeptidase